MEDDIPVIIPGGPKKRSLVHEVPPGHLVDESTGRYRILDPDGRMVKDCGPMVEAAPRSESRSRRAGEASPLIRDYGWVAAASWDIGRPIGALEANWTVPSPPQSLNNQLIFLFPGIQNGSMILQPVLQWGNSSSGPGGNYWQIASWYVGSATTGPAFHSPFTRVDPGQNLWGLLKMVGFSHRYYHYTCEFPGVPVSGYGISTTTPFNDYALALEVYNMSSCADYPAQGSTIFRQIDARAGGAQVTPVWSIWGSANDCSVSSSSPSPDQVNVFFPSHSIKHQ